MRSRLHSAARPRRGEPLPAGHPLDAPRSELARPSAEASAEVARYIAAMTAEMAGMAGSARMEMLAYFLEMARREAEYAARDAHD